MTTKPLHEDVPLDHAWVVGRRIYVRCPKESRLNRELIELGATWDWEVHARYVGTVKRSAVLALVLADEQREQAARDEAARQVAAGHWVPLPRDVEGVVTATYKLAEKLGAVWDRDGWRYALPDDSTRARLQRALDKWLADREADRQRTAEQRRERLHAEAAEREREQAEAKQADEDRARRARERVLAAGGHTATGETIHRNRYSTEYLNRAGAEARAWQVGAVRRLDDGRRAVVVERHIRFWSEDQASEYSYEVQLPDEAHWAFTYTLAVIEDEHPVDSR